MDNRDGFSGGSFFMGVLLGMMATHACQPTEVVHRHTTESESRPRIMVNNPCSKGQIEVRMQQISMEDGEAIGISDVMGGPDRAYVISYGNDVTPVVPFGWTCPQKK